MEIAKGSKVVGTVAVEGDAVVRGALEGELRCARALVHGWVRGTIHAAEEVVIAEKADVEATIHAPRVVVAGGARFQGTIEGEEALPPRLQAERAASTGPGLRPTDSQEPTPRPWAERAPDPDPGLRPTPSHEPAPLQTRRPEAPPAIPPSALRFASSRHARRDEP